MRIVLVSQEYPPETGFGGIGSQTYMKAHGLASCGHDVTVVSHSTDNAIRESTAAGVTVIRIPGADYQMPIHTDAARWLTYSHQVAVALARLCAERAIDLIDFPEWGSEGYIHLLNRAEWSAGPKVVIHLHGPVAMFGHAMGWPDVNSEFYRTAHTMEGACVRLADAVFSSSRCSAQWCEREYGVPAAAIPVIHTGIDTRVFCPQPVEKENRPTVIFIGKIAANKGVNELVDAACRIATEVPGLRVRLIGRGDSALVQKLQAKAAGAGLADLLDFPGFVRRESLPGELSRCHVFVAPSVYEGGPGFVYLEAMACGLPVIACSGSGASEVIEHERNGLLVPPHDDEALSAAMLRLLSNANERDRMGRYAVAYVAAEADSRRCLDRIEAFYASVIADRKREG